MFVTVLRGTAGHGRQRVSEIARCHQKTYKARHADVWRGTVSFGEVRHGTVGTGETIPTDQRDLHGKARQGEALCGAVRRGMERW